MITSFRCAAIPTMDNMTLTPNISSKEVASIILNLTSTQ